MKITEIKFQNILSFKDFNWSGIDEGLNVIVGPNGAGKSNIFIAINFLKDFLSGPFKNYDFNGEHKWLINADKKDADKCKICIGIEFDKDDEEELFKHFFTLILQTTIRLDPPTGISTGECFNEVLNRIKVEAIDDFFKGTLIFEFDENNPSGLIYYIFEKSSKQISLYLKGGQISNSLIIGDKEPLLGIEPRTNIKDFPSYNDLKIKILEAYNQCMNRQEISDTKELSFSFDEILNKILNEVKKGNQCCIYGFEAKWDESFDPSKNLKMALKINQNINPSPPTFFSLFNHIIREKIIKLDNFRIPYIKDYPVDKIENSHPNLADGKDLALYLHKLRNGNQEEKKKFTEINSLFSNIANAHLDLRYQFLSENQNYDQEVKFTIMVIKEKEKENIAIPLEYSGAGIQELVLLISLLKIPSSEGCILLLDEPAANLHSIMQKKLLSKFKNIVNDKEQSEQNINKNQIFIISHSSHFIPKEKFSFKSTKRIYLDDNGYSAISREIEKENTINIASMSLMTNFSDNLISSLFASCVILCEGDNDYLALPIWFEKCKFEKYKKEYIKGNSLHDYNIMLFSLDGWEKVEYAINFLDSFEIPYVALLDPDTMLNGNKSIFKKIDLEIPELSNKDKINEAIKLLKDNFIFIYGDNEDFVSSNGETFREIISKNLSISFEDLNRLHKNARDISKNAREKYGDDKNKAFSISFAEETNPPEEIKVLFEKALKLAGAK
jgi:predicted ATP-dependent endonuclease of OLD family